MQAPSLLKTAANCHFAEILGELVFTVTLNLGKERQSFVSKLRGPWGMFGCVARLSKKAVAAVCVLGAVAFLSGANSGAQAAACSAGTYDFSGAVTANSGCFTGPSTSTDSATLLNTDAAFGLTNWTELDKWDSGSLSNVNGLLNITPDATSPVVSGSWSIAGSVFSSYQSVLLVLKDGKNIPDGYVAYLVTVANGTFVTPFVNDLTSFVQKNIGHFTLYASTTALTATPIPGSLLLFATALLAGTFGYRRWGGRSGTGSGPVGL